MAAILPFRNRLIYPGGSGGLNPAHPASKNCVMSAIPGTAMAVPTNPATGAGTAAPFYLNLVTGRALELNSLGSTPGYTYQVDGIVGPGAAWFNSGNSIIGLNINFTTAQSEQVTVGAIFRYTTSPAYQNLVSFDNSAQGLWIHADKPAYFTNVDNSPSFSCVDAHAYFIAASIFSNAAGPIAGINYVLRDLGTGQIWSQTVAQTATQVTITQVSIGNDSALDHFFGTIAATMYSRTYLNLQQLQQWGQDPWAFWYPPDDLTMMLSTPPAAALPSTVNLAILGLATAESG